MSARNPTFKPFSRRLVERLARGRWMGPGLYVYVLHRLTGVLLTLYLYLHLAVLGSVLMGRNGFQRAMALMDNRAVRLAELGLVWTVLFHGLNGLRLTALNLGPDLEQKSLARAVAAISFAAAGAGFKRILGVR